MEKDIQGVIVPLITPLKDGTIVDIAGLSTLIDHVVEGGVNALFILGTTGEGPCLSSEAKQDMIVHTARQLRGKKKMVVGITDSSPEESIKWSRLAADHGAHAEIGRAHV